MSLTEKKYLTRNEKKNKKQNPLKKNQNKIKDCPISACFASERKYHHRHYLDITQGLSVIADVCS